MVKATNSADREFTMSFDENFSTLLDKIRKHDEIRRRALDKNEKLVQIKVTRRILKISNRLLKKMNEPKLNTGTAKWMSAT